MAFCDRNYLVIKTHRAASVRSCEKMKSAPRSSVYPPRRGGRRIAGGKREARSPRAERHGTPPPARGAGRALAPLPGCDPRLSLDRGLRFAYTRLPAVHPWRGGITDSQLLTDGPFAGLVPIFSQLLTVAALYWLAGITADSRCLNRKGSCICSRRPASEWRSPSVRTSMSTAIAIPIPSFRDICSVFL